MRAELEHRILEAGRQLDVDWSAQRALRIREGVAPKARARRRARAALTSAAVLALAVGLGAGWRALTPGEVVVSPTSTAARIGPQVADATGATVTVHEGGAWFEVPKQAPGKRFRVVAGEVNVEVLGTRFLVERVEHGAVVVAVDHGRVQVRWPGQSRVLEAGDRLTVEPAPQALAPAGAVPVEPPPSAPDVAPPAARPEAPRPAPRPQPARALPPEWRRLAELGDFVKAFEAMKLTRATPRDEPEELLLAADVARLSHHPEDALAPLQRLVATHQKDPRTPLAAFTLGRVLLDDLGRPHEAAEAFAETRTLAPGGPLAEDALAREVEAVSRTGDVARARLLAQLYQSRYPTGGRLRAVRHHGGLE